MPLRQPSGHSVARGSLLLTTGTASIALADCSKSTNSRHSAGAVSHGKISPQTDHANRGFTNSCSDLAIICTCFARDNRWCLDQYYLLIFSFFNLDQYY
jgi:hypothetical protein